MMLDWSQIRYFKPEEWKTDSEKVDPLLVYLLDEIRHAMGPIIIHVCFEATGHVADTRHTLVPCDAVDFHCIGIPLIEAYLELERWRDIGGLGIYPIKKNDQHPKGWNNPGFHIDLRPGDRGARWWRDGQGKYQPITRQFLHELSKI